MIDTVIIGAGPAGITAAIYAVRAGNSVKLFDAYMAGGQLMNTPEVENYPALGKIDGVSLAMKFAEHAQQAGIEVDNRSVTAVRRENLGFVVAVSDGTEEKCRCVIIATGTKRRPLGIEGEDRLRGRGVSYCASCDGNFFRGKRTLVVGGGNTAVEDALYLSKLCSSVTLIHRRDAFRASPVLVNAMEKEAKISILLDSVPEEIKGDDKVTAVSVRNVKTGEVTEIPADGVFVAVGLIPNLPEMPEGLEISTDGSIMADDATCATNIPGLYAAGDIRTKHLRQIITAAADGAIAAASASEYIASF